MEPKNIITLIENDDIDKAIYLLQKKLAWSRQKVEDQIEFSGNGYGRAEKLRFVTRRLSTRILGIKITIDEVLTIERVKAFERKETERRYVLKVQNVYHSASAEGEKVQRLYQAIYSNNFTKFISSSELNDMGQGFDAKEEFCALIQPFLKEN